MAIHAPYKAGISLKNMCFIEAVMGNALIDDSAETDKFFCSILPLPLGWVRLLFRVNRLWG